MLSCFHSCLTVKEDKESELSRPQSIQYIPNIYIHQEKPFMCDLPTSVTMASDIQDCSLITPPDTPSPQMNNLAERFGEPRRCSSREHRPTTFYNSVEADPTTGVDNNNNNPRKRKIKYISGGARVPSSRRMLEYSDDESSKIAAPLTENTMVCV